MINTYIIIKNYQLYFFLVKLFILDYTYIIYYILKIYLRFTLFSSWLTKKMKKGDVVQ